MATREIIDDLAGYAHAFRTMDRTPVLRPQLGTASPQTELAPIFDELSKRIGFASEVAYLLHDKTVRQLTSVIEQIANLIHTQANLDETQYVANKSTFINSVKDKAEELKLYWTPFLAAGLEARGLLDDQGIKEKYTETIESVKAESTKAIDALKLESKRILDEANNMADQIVKRARGTAVHISVKAAQDVFDDAKKPLFRQAVLWASLGALGITAFLWFAYYFYQAPLFTDKQSGTDNLKWMIIYKSVFRLVILTVIGALTTFCLKIFRASMHMYHHNMHRLRITNSMAAFVESAVTPEQRDLILTHLVDAIAAFGCSGLIQGEDDSMNLPKMTIDNITRNLAPK